jgi:hypothetical protein
MPITRSVWTDDDGTGTTGTVLNNSELQKIYGNIDALVGTWQNEPFSGSHFGAVAPMVWTLDPSAVLRNRYVIIGKTLFWALHISWYSGGNVLAGTPSPTLRMTLPGGVSAKTEGSGAQFKLLDQVGGVAGVAVFGGLGLSASTGTSVTIAKAGAGNFALSDTPGFIGTIIVEIA